MIAVSVSPGQMACTAMPSASTVGARERTKPTTACFVSEYTGSSAKGTIPARDAVATMTPPRCCARIVRIAARAPNTTPSTFTPRMRAYSSSSSAPMSVRASAMPALRNARSTAPSASTQCANAASVSLGRDTSAAIALPRTSSATRRAPSPSRSTQHRRIPSAARRRAVARPIPDAAPVTSAARPSRSTRRTLRRDSRCAQGLRVRSPLAPPEPEHSRMGLPARFAANRPAVVDEMIDGEVVVIDLRSGNYFSLVESAAVIWASLAARPTHDEVAAALGGVYEAEPEQCFAVSGAFLDVLVGEGLVVQVDAADEQAAAPDVPSAAGPLPEPRLEKFDDMQQLILLDPVHEIDETVGWPRMRPEETPD